MALNLYLFPRLRSVWYGATLPLRALQLILSRPSLLLWSAFPILITFGLYTFLIMRLQAHSQLWIRQVFQSHGWSLENWTGALALLFVKLLIFLVGALTFSWSATIVASPFNDFLAERAEQHTEPPLERALQTSWLGKARLIAIDLMKTLAASVITLAALVLSWAPGLNVLVLALTFLLVSFQFLSYPQTRRGEDVSKSAQFLIQHPFACISFGAVLSFLFALPLVSCFTLPLAVVGGTLLYARAQAMPGRFPLK